MQSVLKLLKIHSTVAVAGYHSTTALAERWIRTVEMCLKSYIFEYTGNWNRLLPWIAFTLRQTPCSFNGYSAHELVYGKNLRDSLDELRDEIMGDVDTVECTVKRNVLTYLSDLRKQLEISRKVAAEHATAVQDRTKKWYDAKSSSKEFLPDDQVIILIPDDTRKLFARWSEAKKVVRRINCRNYLVDMGNGKTKIFHVNQLRRYTQPVEYTATVVTADANCNAEDSHIKILQDDDVTNEIDCGQFKIEMSLPQEQQEQLKALLTEFKDVFRPTLGETHLAVHHIKLRDTTPCVRPQYRIPESLKQPLQEEIERLIAAGIVRECESEYRAPLIPIRKPNGTIRICNDFSLLNSRCHDDLFPMSCANEVLSLAAGRLWVSRLDLTKAFLQVPLSIESQPLTAFQTHNNTYCFTRMAAGLKNAPRTMERLLRNLLKGTSSYANSLLDDVIVSSNTFELHLEHLRQILSRFRMANLTASITKSEFLIKSLDVLGHTIEQGEIKPSQKHIDSILRLGPQKTKQGVRAVLGTVQYYSHMIPNLAGITAPLTELIKRDQPDKNIRWNDRHSEALDKIKAILTSKPVLVAPKFDRGFILMTDATMSSVAGILSQKCDQGVERNIGYYSRKMIPRESNYSVIEKECLAILASVIHWKQWIYGYPVEIRTDHSSLRYLSSASKHNSRLARWNIILADYQLTWTYRKASNHGNADGLSRMEISE